MSKEKRRKKIESGGGTAGIKPPFSVLQVFIMNILAIGNSFSEDATRYLQDIAESAGSGLLVRNCYIGGCSLERHVGNIKTGEQAYAYQENSQALRMISIGAALRDRKWDYVTVQQVSGLSGIYDSYEPYLTELIGFIKAKAPEAEVVFHRTWAYEIDSGHGDFPGYDCDQGKMYTAIVKASSRAASEHGLRIIGTGDTVQKVREIKEFDYGHGGLSLCRDGYHLSLDYGRYLAGLVWYKFFTGRSAFEVKFAPENTEQSLIDILKNAVK